MTKTCQCHDTDDFKCGFRCDKSLNCSVHKCKKTCHSGNCDKCAEEIYQTCYCKRECRFVRCTKESSGLRKYSCDEVCDKRSKYDNQNDQPTSSSGMENGKTPKSFCNGNNQANGS